MTNMQYNCWNTLSRYKKLPSGRSSRLTSQHELTRAYLENDQIEKAVQRLEQVVKIKETTLKEDHLDRLVSQHVLACDYQANGQIQKAVQLLEHVVKIRSVRPRASIRR